MASVKETNDYAEQMSRDFANLDRTMRRDEARVRRFEAGVYGALAGTSVWCLAMSEIALFQGVGVGIVLGGAIIAVNNLVMNRHTDQ